MTEAEWLSSTDPHPMLEFLRGTASERRLRLFRCACFRALPRPPEDQRSHRAVDVVERYANGDSSEEELAQACVQAFRAYEKAGAGADPGTTAAYNVTRTCLVMLRGGPLPFHSAIHGVTFVLKAASCCNADPMRQAHLLRDIFGNPFRPAALDPACLTPDVVALAGAIYDARAFHRMPELADALEQAGLSDAQVLAHLRQSGEHVRGCWMIDLVLGKQ